MFSFSLEVALSKFTTLTLGDTILLRNFGQDFHLNVIEMTPATHNPVAGSLVDTVLNVDFAPPVEKPVEEVSKVEMDSPIEGRLSSDQFAYFQVKIRDPSKAVLFDLEATSGHPDIYVSTKHNKVGIFLD
jgi:hypothetical protein